MIRKTIAFLILISLVTIPVWAAEFYRYVDKHGNVLFTDDLSNVPPEQRENVTAYEGSKTVEPVEAQSKAQEKVQDDKIKNQAQEGTRQRLEAMGKELDQEYEKLMEVRKELDEEKNQAVTNAQIKAYNQKIVEFNTRIKTYDEKRTAYADEVKQFNAQLQNNNPDTVQTQP